MILKIEYVGKVRRDDGLLLELAKANNVKVSSIVRWLRPSNRKGNKLLTTIENLNIIRRHFQVSDTAELLEEETIAEVK